MLKTAISFILLSFIPLFAHAQSEEWAVEAEDGLGTVSWKGETCYIDAPKGLTLWNKNLMEGNVVIEYEARIMSKPRVSDLNCFWMADRCGGYGGKFVNNYALKMYYMGYGGNYNSTTRFRRYTGDVHGVDSAQYRPIILKEYTDKAHLLVGNHWYKVRLEAVDGHVKYFIDGNCIVDYVDPAPLKKGYFGFRTTLAKAQLRNFKYECKNPDDEPIVVIAPSLLPQGGVIAKRSLHPSLGGNEGGSVVTFGVPFSQGEKYDESFTVKAFDELPHSTWRLASWPDGSIKWQAFCVNIPVWCDSLFIMKTSPNPSQGGEQLSGRHHPSLGGDGFKEMPPFYVTVNNHIQPVLSSKIERTDKMHSVIKYIGKNFIIRTYDYFCSDEKKLVHTLLVDSALNKEGLKELSIHFKVPMHGKEYERYVQFYDNKTMSVQPLVARRNIDLEKNDATTKSMILNIAKWDGFRLSQLSANGYSIRKRATKDSPWIGTYEGSRHNGQVTIGDSVSSTTFRLKDFWQSFPSTLQVDNARSDTAIVTISLYSPEAEPYCFEHYDTIPHTLEAAYEDVQPGMSTAWGIGRTSEIWIECPPTPERGGYPDGKHQDISGGCPPPMGAGGPYCCTPEYLHRKRAFGIWSLPTVENSRDSLIESTLSDIMSFYEKEIERNGWYGFFNYGDVMHAYDASRDEWRYDVGGFAWDNTELGTPAMFWYQFLRTGDPKVWRMAEAMTRHCSEVDTYHIGPHAGLGSRHNVLHWGCGAKESRISEAWWNRFYYYLTGGDERIGDILDEVVDSDTLLYTLDPMRLAQPREQYPCTAPARLRLGPDWLGYVSNWFTEYERRDKKYLGKIEAGMNSIAAFPHGFFEGPKALGYYPATGVITNECDSTILNTNHLMTIMGGFELVNEMETSIPHPAFYEKWLEHAKLYKQEALRISRNKFLVPRLSAYAGWRLGDEKKKQEAWNDLLNNMPLPNNKTTKPQIWTNDCATWTLDAVFMKETIK